MPVTRQSNTPREDEAPSKRPRLKSPRPARQTRAREQDTSTSEEQRAINVGATPTTMSMPEALSRYKSWRKAGSPHDSICFICFKPKDLEGCDTCRRSYHTSCMPASSSRGLGEGSQSEAWYCDVCVDRGWHENPPMITPPDSPVLGAVERPRELLSEQTGAGDSDTIPAARSSAHRPAPPTVEPRPTQSIPLQATTRTQQLTSTANEGVRRGPKIATSNTAPTLFGSRKSRYNTLSEDVESALAVLYRELEKIPFLDQKIEELESEVSRLDQEVRIQRNELALSHRISVSATELQRLRSEAAGRQAAVDEAARLAARNQELESHIAELREQSTKSNQSLQGLKQKLSTLIGD
ncbi:hypothetical protein BDV12DRAFT_160394 [Aspergillus spectabilis]